MKIALTGLCFLLMLNAPAWARLGETGDQIVARYGQPLSQIDQKALGKKVALTVLIFQKNGYEIQVSLSDGVSDEESYRKLNGDVISLAEARTLLTINAQGFGWEEPTDGNGVKIWTRDDAATAILSDGGHSLTIASKDLIDKENAAKKAETTPSLDGF